MLACDSDVILLTETWLHNNVLSSEFFGDKYNVYRCDRIGTRGGGVLIAVDAKYRSEELPFKSPITDVDLIAVKVYNSYNSIILINLYIPPSQTTFMYEGLFDCLENYCCNSDLPTVLTGDFNIPELQNYYESNRFSPLCNLLQNFINICRMEQHNRILNTNSRILDLFVTSDEITCSVSHDEFALVEEDNHHPGLFANLQWSEKYDKFENNGSTTTSLKYNFRKTNFNELYNAITMIDWRGLEKIQDVDEACDFFYNKLYDTMDIYVPKTIPFQSTYPPWFTKDIIGKIKTKNHYVKIYKKHKLLEYTERIKNLKREIKSSIRREYNIFVKSVQNNIKINPNELWNYVNAKKKATRIPGNMTFNDEPILHPQDIVNSFATYFKSMFLENDNNCDSPSDNDHVSSGNNVLHTFDVSVCELRRAVRKIKPNFTMGVDNIPAFFVKDCISCLELPLCHLFSLILKQGVFPKQWKVSKICPVFKSGNKSCILNYRPIGIIPNFAKIFESIVSHNVSSHVARQLCDSQHGFIKGRSTATNLCNFTQFVSGALDQRMQVDVIYTDFTKAFDRVHHGTIINKLKYFGLCDNLIILFSSLLTERFQYVEYRGFKSMLYSASSGVTQGSNLGPLMFLLFVNDVVVSLDSKTYLYADDLKIVRVIHNEHDCQTLQSDINSLTNWCVANKLSLNTKKCQVMTFSRKRERITYEYAVNDVTLTRSYQIKDLGVIFDPELSFIPHYDYISNRSIKMLGFIIRNTRNFTNIDCLKTLYFAFVRSCLEYCTVVWSPHYNVHIQAIERIQRKFCKYMYFIKYKRYPDVNYNYTDLVNEFNLEPLYIRRKVSYIMQLYKLVHGHVDNIEFLNLLQFHVPRIGSRNSPTFRCDIPCTNQHKNSPLLSMCRLYNEVQYSADIFCEDLNVFLRATRETVNTNTLI